MRWNWRKAPRAPTDGGWRMADGGWRMADGGWRMADGSRTAGDASPMTHDHSVVLSGTMSTPDRLFDEKRPLEIADQGCFYAGGRYVEEDGKRSLLGQMFVQYQIPAQRDRKSTRLNSSHSQISYAVFCLKK